MSEHSPKALFFLDVMEYGRVPKADAKRYFDYFEFLQGKNLDCLSNGQLVAGILALIEADPEGDMLRKMREVDVSQYAPNSGLKQIGEMLQ